MFIDPHFACDKTCTKKYYVKKSLAKHNFNLFRPHVKRAHESQTLSLTQLIEATIFGIYRQFEKDSMLIVIPIILVMISDQEIRIVNFSHDFYAVIS